MDISPAFLFSFCLYDVIYQETHDSTKRALNKLHTHFKCRLSEDIAVAKRRLRLGCLGDNSWAFWLRHLDNRLR
jgi:hypothetical protein